MQLLSLSDVQDKQVEGACAHRRKRSLSSCSATAMCSGSLRSALVVLLKTAAFATLRSFAILTYLGDSMACYGVLASCGMSLLTPGRARCSTIASAAYPECAGLWCLQKGLSKPSADPCADIDQLPANLSSRSAELNSEPHVRSMICNKGNQGYSPARTPVLIGWKAVCA